MQAVHFVATPNRETNTRAPRFLAFTSNRVSGISGGDVISRVSGSSSIYTNLIIISHLFWISIRNHFKLFLWFSNEAEDLIFIFKLNAELRVNRKVSFKGIINVCGRIKPLCVYTKAQCYIQCGKKCVRVIPARILLLCSLPDSSFIFSADRRS